MPLSDPAGTADLTLEHLTKRFGAIVAVDDISLSVPAGQMVGIIGRSGAGKSTLLRLVNRLIEPTSGSIRHGGTDITALKGSELRAWRAEAAMIFQQFNLAGRLNVLTNVLVGRLRHMPAHRSLFKLFGREDRARALLALERLDMAPFALQRADRLSGGQQQRVAIARALVQEPKILLADEPIASLDPRNAEAVMDALRRINQEDGITVLCNLHTLDTARAYCDRLIGLDDGKLVFDGPPSALTPAAVRAVYGSEDHEAINEALTSTSLDMEHTATA